MPRLLTATEMATTRLGTTSTVGSMKPGDFATPSEAAN